VTLVNIGGVLVDSHDPAERPRAWLWRAWTDGRSRIADCGIARAPTKAEAERIAWMTLGGPHAGRVVEMQIEEV
jgi:hypothetical protein